MKKLSQTAAIKISFTGVIEWIIMQLLVISHNNRYDGIADRIYMVKD